MNDFSLKLKPVYLSVDELKEMAEVMAVGNTALKDCAAMMGMDDRDFRKVLFRDKLVMTPEQKEKVDIAKPLILTVKNKCEDRLQCAFFKWATKQATIISIQANDSHHAFEDLQAEGMWAIVDATYSYTDTSIKIPSFVRKVARRRMLSAYNKMNPLCPLTNEALRLRKMFEEQKTTYDDRVTDQEVIDDMNLPPKQQKVLIRSMTQVVSQQQLESDNVNASNDYTVARRGIDNDFKEIFSRTEIRQAVKNANLNPLELETFLTSLCPHHGWQESIAAKHTNERTGKRLTRQYIFIVRDRAESKVKSAYLNPPKEHLENEQVDQWFDEMNGNYAV
jgi:hypothetical protein